MVVVDGLAYTRYQDSCNHRDDVGWSARFRKALT